VTRRSLVPCLLFLAAVAGPGCAGGPALKVTITSPGSGGVKGVVTLVAAVEPADAVSQLDFVVDGVSVGTVTSAPFSVDWDTTSYVGQSVAVTARARSTSGALALSPPVHLLVSAVAPPLNKGKESMYTLVNQGSKLYADELLQDEWDFGLRSTPYYMNPLDWTADPYHDSYWRLLFYSLRPTSNLLWAYYTTGDTAYRDKLLAILSSYAAYDKTRTANLDTFDDSTTAAFRAMVLVNSYAKLKRSGDLPASLDADLQTAIAKVANAIASADGTGVPTGNGLFNSDYSGLFTAAGALLLVAQNFPTLAGSATWNKVGLDRLNTSVADALDAQRIEVENSPFYHFYLMTFAQEIATWASLWGVPLLAGYPATIDAMSDYATYILQPNGKIPLLAASVALSLASLDTEVETHIAARDPEFAYVVSQGDAGLAPTRSRLFWSSGQSILRSPLDQVDGGYPEQSFVTLNVGHPRDPQNHLDVLGLTYFSGGRGLITDSGLFTYDAPDGGSADSGAHPYFAYFHGTSAHNTVVVDGQDQSTAQGMPVTAGLTVPSPDADAGSPPDWAYQSGSHGLYQGVTHQRGVLLLRQDLLLVVDRLTSTDPHSYVQTWHLAPGLGVSRAPGEPSSIATDANANQVLAIIQGDVGATVLLATSQGLDLPGRIQGWYSESYGIKVPNPVLEYHQDNTSSASFITLIASGGFATATPKLFVDENDTVIRLRVCAGSVQTQVEINHLAAAAPDEHVLVTSTAGCPR